VVVVVTVVEQFAFASQVVVYVLLVVVTDDVPLGLFTVCELVVVVVAVPAPCCTHTDVPLIVPRT
jgi:hypothetical protein